MAGKPEKKVVKADKPVAESHKKAEKPLKMEKESKAEAKRSEKATKASPSFYDPWNVLMYPHLTEKSMNTIEMENKLVFIVRRTARKSEIVKAVQEAFNVTVDDINVQVTRKGKKKAVVKLSDKDSAADIASRMGMI